MSEIIKLPGLIDLHTHLRDPGDTHKEDIYTGTSAALAGGITTVVDMPNNRLPITSSDRLEKKLGLAAEKAVCDIGFNFTSLGDNFDIFEDIYDKVVGLKLFLSETTGGYTIDLKTFENTYSAWKSDKPIFLHAENEVLKSALEITKKNPKKVHICHVSNEYELSSVIDAKNSGMDLTCGVTPHHLFISEEDVSKPEKIISMKPVLGHKSDREYLWNHLDQIDIFESDHAPHALEEKISGKAPYGVPNLETMLPLLLKAESEGKLTRDDLIDKLHTTPAKIISLNTEQNTYCEVEMIEYKVRNEELLTKCGWSPYAGWDVLGKVRKVFIRGKLVFENGKVVANPGSAKIIS